MAEDLSPGGQDRFLTLHFSLKTNAAELEQRLLAGQIPTKAEVLANYSGDRAGARSLGEWLKAQGIGKITITPDFASVYAVATVSQVHQALHVDFQSIQVNGQRTATAVSAPVLPSNLASHVVAIDGLQPWVQVQKQIVSRSDYLRTRPASAGPSSASLVPGLSLPSAAPLLTKDLVARYNVPATKVTGRGQNIAILIDKLPLRTDLARFWRRNGLPVDQSRVKFVNLRGPRQHLPSPDGEESLDTEWASGMAPGAHVIVYATGSEDWPALDLGLDTILADAAKPGGPTQLSISLGLREDMVSADEITADHARFVRLVGLGVTVFASSGDAGSNPDWSGHLHSSDSQVEYPASDSAVIAVGGTSLDRDLSGKVVETCWTESGGGVSGKDLVALHRPTWQKGYSGIKSNLRLVPDVSSLADPVPGAVVFVNGRQTFNGGTSWSTPVWAAFGALLEEQRTRNGGPRPAFLAHWIYDAHAAGAFRDVGIGSNGEYGTNGRYTCGPAWNPVTGLGVPDLGRLTELVK